MPKKILGPLLFLGLLGLLLVPASLILQPKDNTEEAGMYQTSAAGILSQPENSIEVLFLGDSEAYSSFVPLDLWEQTGITSFVCSSLDQKTYETLELLDMALGCQSPKVVVLETNVLYRVYASTDALSPKLEARIPALRYHDRWKSLSLSDFCSMPRYTASSPDRGYHLLTKAKAADVEGYMAPMEEREPLSRTNLADLKKITEVCRKRGISLVLFSAPSPANWTMRRHNTIQDTAESLGRAIANRGDAVIYGAGKYGVMGATARGVTSEKGELIGTITGDIRAILSGERVALNYLQRMSGIATFTLSLAKELEDTNTTLLDTRKTTPNMRPFEKYAVTVGGGTNHRYNLSDGVLIKDNHIGAAGSITKAVEMAREYAPFVRKIEVETESLEMVKEALEAKADIIMLDNMDNDTMRKAVEMIGDKAQTECSGNVTKERLKEIADIGVNFVSAGALTYAAPIMDISLKNLKPL